MSELEQMAPIVLFVYNRMEHTKRTIEALQKAVLAQESDLFIYSDGPKAGEEALVQELRTYLKEIDGFRNVKLIERNANWGLAKSVIHGVTDVVSQYGKVIVLEDDIVCREKFLVYMNKALETYKKEKKVFSISAYSYLKDEYKNNIPDTYFLDIICSWGWATWKDRWELFDGEATGYRRLKWNFGLRRKFDYDGIVDYYKMLMAQIQSQNPRGRKPARKIDSWAIRWYWTCFKENGVNLYPRDSYVENIGFDGSGVHCKNRMEKENMTDSFGDKSEFEFPKKLEEIKEIRENVKASLREV